MRGEGARPPEDLYHRTAVPAVTRNFARAEWWVPHWSHPQFWGRIASDGWPDRNWGPAHPGALERATPAGPPGVRGFRPEAFWRTKAPGQQGKRAPGRPLDQRDQDFTNGSQQAVCLPGFVWQAWEVHCDAGTQDTGEPPQGEGGSGYADGVCRPVSGCRPFLSGHRICQQYGPQAGSRAGRTGSWFRRAQDRPGRKGGGAWHCPWGSRDWPRGEGWSN